MKKYLIIYLLPLLNFSYAKGDFLISDSVDFWIMAIPIGIIIVILAIIFISGGNPPKNTNKDEDENNKDKDSL